MLKTILVIIVMNAQGVVIDSLEKDISLYASEPQCTELAPGVAETLVEYYRTIKYELVKVNASCKTMK